MQSLIEPNIHPILVHFAYALTVTGALSLLLHPFFRQEDGGIRSKQPATGCSHLERSR